jgi:hypothetical protein
MVDGISSSGVDVPDAFKEVNLTPEIITNGMGIW